MARKMKEPDQRDELRLRAEERLAKSGRDVTTLPAVEIEKLVHELRVYQIELEMQNDELRRTELELNASRDGFRDLYDFAPVGYLTHDPKGVILEANLTVAALLGMDRRELIGRKLSRFVHPSDQDTLHFHNTCVASTPWPPRLHTPLDIGGFRVQAGPTRVRRRC